MVQCDYCGRTYAGSSNNALIGGWYNVCSERCRLAMRQSVDAGTTRAYRNPVEGGLRRLVKVLVVCGVGSFALQQCGRLLNLDSQTTSASTVQESPAISSEPAVESPPTRQTAHALPDFDYEEPTEAAVVEPTTNSASEIRTIPAPEAAEVDAETQAVTDSSASP